MERKIKLRMIFIGLFTVIITALLVSTSFYKSFYTQVTNDLKITAKILTSEYNKNHDINDIPQDLKNEFRITLISPEGIVLYENSQMQGLGNHLDRPEIQSAFKEGYGQSKRQSTTLLKNTFYYAILTSDGNVLRLAKDVSSMYEIYNSTLLYIFICCAIIIIIAIIMSIRLTKQLLKPISNMAEHLDDVENYIPYPELKPLASSIQSDFQMRKKHEQIRQEFTANVSHELKTPLTGILGFSELIETGIAKQDDVPALAGQIRKEASRMLTLVNDIINLTELDTMEASMESLPEMTTVNLKDLAEHCLSIMDIASKKAYIILSSTGFNSYVNGNASLLSELFENLVENAIKYNSPGGKVTIFTGYENGFPILKVSDTGIGIPKSAQPRVFERFFRVDKSRSKSKGGTGLGLAIVKHIVILHKAKINLVSYEGKGTEITVIFPKNK